MKVKEAKEIEEIEEYYLSVIAKYLGVDLYGFISSLESHNKTYNYWEKSFNGTSQNPASVGSERVTYMLLNRSEIFGVPNGNPIGSDSSFLKYDPKYNKNLAINIDVKTFDLVTNFNDIMNNIPVGKNQCSYPYADHALQQTYKIKLYKNVEEYLTLTYFVCIGFAIPTINIPNNIKDYKKENQKVAALFICCVPNGKLSKAKKYSNCEVFSPGKNNKSKRKDSRFNYINTKFFHLKGGEKKQSRIKILHYDSSIMDELSKLSWQIKTGDKKSKSPRKNTKAAIDYLVRKSKLPL